MGTVKEGLGCGHSVKYAILLVLAIGVSPIYGADLTVPGTHATAILAAAASVSGDTVTVTGGPYAGFTETSANVKWIGPFDTNTVNFNSEVVFSGGQCTFTGFVVDCGLTGGSGSDCVELHTAGGNLVYRNVFRGFLNRAVYINSVDTNVVMLNIATDVFGVDGVSGGSCIIVCRGDDNLVFANKMSDANIDFIGYAGDRNRFINNTGRNSNTNSSAHPDFFQTGGTGHSLGGDDTVKEANYHEDSIYPSVHHHGHNTEDNGSGFFRDLNLRNIYVRVGNGIGAWFQTWNGIYIVNEGYFGAHRQFEGEDFNVELTAQQAFFASGTTANMRVFNSMFIDCWGPDASSVRVYVMDGTGLAANFNHAWDTRETVTYSTPFTSEANELTTDPLLGNYAGDDFRLTGSSPGKASGGAVTTVASMSGTGTSFDVGDGGFFRGTNAAMWGIGTGSKITVGTDQLIVTAVSGNTLTVNISFTWALNDSVYHGWSTTPDRGPYPFGHIPLTSASFSGTTVTTVGDARFVMAFTNGILATIDYDAPYEFAGLSTPVVYVACAEYATQTPWVVASEAAAGGGSTYRNKGRSVRNAGVTP